MPHLSPPQFPLRPPVQKAMIAVAIIASCVVTAFFVLDFSGVGLDVAMTREYGLGIAVVLMLAAVYTFFRSGDDDNRGPGDRTGGLT